MNQQVALQEIAKYAHLAGTRTRHKATGIISEIIQVIAVPHNSIQAIGTDARWLTNNRQMIDSHPYGNFVIVLHTKTISNNMVAILRLDDYLAHYGHL